MAAASVPPATAAASSEELVDSERSRSRTRPKRRRRGAGAEPSFQMKDMKDALRSVIEEMHLATKTDLAELDARIQKVEEEVGKLPDMAAAEVSRQLKDKTFAEPSAGGSSRPIWVPSTMMVRGWATFQEPSTQATSAEVHSLWDQLQKRLSSGALDHLSLVRPASQPPALVEVQELAPQARGLLGEDPDDPRGHGRRGRPAHLQRQAPSSRA